MTDTKTPIGKKWGDAVHQKRVTDHETSQAKLRKEIVEIYDRTNKAIESAAANGEETCRVNVKGFEPHSIHCCKLGMVHDLRVRAYEFEDDTGFKFEHAVHVKAGREVVWMYVAPHYGE